MYEVYDMWPDLAQEAYASVNESLDFGCIDHVVFAGMGGSGTIGDVFSAILSKANIHVSVVKGYHLPRTVDKNTLVVATSVSGNTDETLGVLKNANGCMTVAFSCGGLIEKYCKENNILHVHISQIHSPRASFVSFLYAMLRSLHRVIPIQRNAILESIDALQSLRKEISTENLSESNRSLSLAKWITGIPVIYYPWGFQAAATRFKNSLHENAKIHAMTEDVMESCHNQIVSWETNSTAQPILIQGPDDHPKTKERWGILKEYFRLKGIEYQSIHSVQGDILAKIVTLIYLFDFCSIYHAILHKVDPTPVESIDYIKENVRAQKFSTRPHLNI